MPITHCSSVQQAFCLIDFVAIKCSISKAEWQAEVHWSALGNKVTFPHNGRHHHHHHRALLIGVMQCSEDNR